VLEGAIDMHIHTAPDLMKRKLSDIEATRLAKEAGMAGILIKNHFEPTVSRAVVAKEVVGEIEVYGGVVLNRSVGGFNPEAVEFALRLGAKEVWMPTVDALNHLAKTGGSLEGGLSILDETGKLRRELYDIIKMVSERGVILGTGHLSLREIFVLVDEAIKLGVRKILVTHPEFWITEVPLEAQRELAKKGVFFERCSFCFWSKNSLSHVSAEKMARVIKLVGVESTVLASDLGQEFNPLPTEGLQAFAIELLKAGLTEKDMEMMLKINPKGLLS